MHVRRRVGPLLHDHGRALVTLLAALAGCAPTWSDDVAPAVAANCVACHQDGTSAPFPLTDYAHAAPMAPAIAAATGSRAMPPWLADASGECGWFEHAEWLDDETIDLFDRWAEAGAPPGDEGVVVEPPPADGLADVDTEVDLGFDFVPSVLPDEHRCFVVDPGFATDRFVTGFEVVPGEPRLVHHVIVYALGSAEADDYAAKFDAEDPAPGYACVGHPGAYPEHVIGSWAPGTPPIELPESVGIRVRAGRKLVLQMHYHPVDGEALVDRTTLRLRTEDRVPNEAVVFPMTNFGMRLEPGLAETSVTSEIDLGAVPRDYGFFVQGVYPHMHRYGRTLTFEIDHGDDTECVLRVPRWDFDWQRLYLYDRPAYAAVDDVLRLRCTYDTTDATEPLVWGGGTDDEMCLLGVLATVFP